METLPAAVLTQIAGEKSRPVSICEIYLDAGTLRYAAAPATLVFPTGGNAYTPIYYKSGIKRTSMNNQVVSCDYQFDNRNSVMHALNAAEHFRGKLFVERIVWRDALASATYYRERMAGYMEEPKFDERWMSLRVIDGKPLEQRAINQYYQQTCNNIFGDQKCNYNGLANLASLRATGTADGGTAATLVDNALTQADDYWNFGTIDITINGYKYTRKVMGFAAATDTITFDVELPVAVAAGSAYTVQKGCPRTWEACKKTYAYGPSADNKVNFNGMLHLQKSIKELK